MDDWQRRIAQLEVEVKLLKQEVQALKSSEQAVEQTIHRPEPHLAQPIVPPKSQKVQEKVIKPQKSFEERLSSLLPKVFMFIFVLGVLWGLKLMSDYGVLSDGVKIALSYTLSIALGTLAWWLIQKQKGVHNVRLALFGGSFIIGILATAASVIIYDVLSLNTALIIAVLYIAYGVWLTYWQANESLTIFIMISSLLLPYLLEYMSFNTWIIIGFILVLYGVIMWIIVKYVQKIALYTTTFFSGFSLAILSWMTTEPSSFYTYGAIACLIIFYGGWVKMFMHVKRPALHIGLLFSIGSIGMLLMHTVEHSVVESMIAFGIAAVVSVAFWQITRRTAAADVFATFALFAVMHVLLLLDVHDEWRLLLLLTTAFAGVMLGIKQHATWMKATQSVVFSVLTLIIYVVHDVDVWLPFLLHSVAVLYLIVLLVYSERTAVVGRFSNALQSVRWTEILRCVAVLLVLAILYKLEMPQLYWMALVIAVLMMLVLVLPEKVTKLVLPIFLTAIFALASVVLWVDYTDTRNVALIFTVRAAYIAVTCALLFVLYKQTVIYKRFAQWIGQWHEQIMLVVSLFLLVHFWTFSAFLQEAFNVADLVHVIVTTVLLFAFAIVYIIVGRMQDFLLWTRTGFIFILIGLVKLVFFDLSTLDLLVRTIVFMLIGAIGLVLSNRLLKK